LMSLTSATTAHTCRYWRTITRQRPASPRHRLAAKVLHGNQDISEKSRARVLKRMQ
jgi:hypothetical protein